MLGQPFVIVNKPGSAGAVATLEVARSTPDGYTFLWATTSPIVIAPLLTNVVYDPLKDLIPVSAITEQTFGLAVHPSVPAQSVSEFQEYVRSHPGLAYADSGFGTASHLSMSLFLRSSGLRMREKSFTSNRAALNEVLSGTVPAMFSILAHTLPHMRSGSIRVLAVTSERRLHELPTVPTMQEAGISNFRTVTWNGLMAPVGTSNDIIQRLAAAVGQIVREPRFSASLAHHAITPLGTSPEEFANMLSADLMSWRQRATEARMSIERHPGRF